MKPEVCGVLLAGGQSRRMGGGDKCLRPLAGKAMLARVIERARPQVAHLLINANGDPQRFAAFGLPVEADHVSGFAGPLAGVLTGMEWAREQAPDCRLLATFATDAPFFPLDLVERLCAAREEAGADIVCASSDGRAHPVFALWPLDLAPALRSAMLEEGLRKVDAFTGRYKVHSVAWPTQPFDPFFNANKPEDLAAAERLVAAEEGAA